MVSISYLFRVSVSSVSAIIRKTCFAIWQTLQPIYLSRPKSPQEWLVISKEFEDIWNMPHCIGAIDGKHTVVQVIVFLYYTDKMCYYIIKIHI
jgi:hypothetical protein